MHNYAPRFCETNQPKGDDRFTALALIECNPKALCSDNTSFAFPGQQHSSHHETLNKCTSEHLPDQPSATHYDLGLDIALPVVNVRATLSGGYTSPHRSRVPLSPSKWLQEHGNSGRTSPPEAPAKTKRSPASETVCPLSPSSTENSLPLYRHSSRTPELQSSPRTAIRIARFMDGDFGCVPHFT